MNRIARILPLALAAAVLAPGARAQQDETWQQHFASVIDGLRSPEVAAELASIPPAEDPDFYATRLLDFRLNSETTFRLDGAPDGSPRPEGVVSLTPKTRVLIRQSLKGATSSPEADAARAELLQLLPHSVAGSNTTVSLTARSTSPAR